MHYVGSVLVGGWDGSERSSGAERRKTEVLWAGVFSPRRDRQSR